MKMVAAIAFVAACFSLSCGGSKPTSDDPRARVSACEMHCAQVGLGLIEQKMYEEAAEPIARALEHIEQPERVDRPRHPHALFAQRLDLDVARLVLARRLDGDVDAASRALAGRINELFDDAHPRIFRLIAIDYLPTRDRLFLVRQLDRLDLQPSRRALVELIWRANSGLPVDRARFGAVEQASTPREHRIAADFYCRVELCERAVPHVAAVLRDQMKRPDDEVEEDALVRPYLRAYLGRADASEREVIEWLAEVAAKNSYSIPLVVPRRAYASRKEACRAILPTLNLMTLQDAQKPEVLLDGAWCAAAVGQETLAWRLVDRAIFLSGSKTEALAMGIELAIVQRDIRWQELAKTLEKIDGDHPALSLRDALHAVSAGKPDVAEQHLRDRPPGPAVSTLRGFIASSRGDYRGAAVHFANVEGEWEMEGATWRHMVALARTGRVAEALEVVSKRYAQNPTRWRSLNLQAAILARDAERFEKLSESVSGGNARCHEMFLVITGQRAFFGEAAARQALDGVLARWTPRQKKRCQNNLLRAGAVTAPDGYARVAADLAANQIRVTRPDSGLATCLDSEEELIEALWRDDNEAHRNYYAWCQAKRGDGERGIEIMPDPRDIPAYRDTLARNLLLAGRVDRAVKMFEQIAAEEPDAVVYVGHLLAARLASDEKPSAQEIEAGVERLVAQMQGLSPDTSLQAVVLLLADQLERAGHPATATHLREVLTVETSTWPVPGLLKKCPTCPAAFEKAWRGAPKIWWERPKPSDPVKQN